MKLNTKKNQAKCVKAITEYLISIGAESVKPMISTCQDWHLQTHAGLLKLSVPLDQDVTYTLFARFEDVAKAKECQQIIKNGRLNPYSGKWNFHYATIDDLMFTIKNEIGLIRIIPPMPSR